VCFSNQGPPVLTPDSALFQKYKREYPLRILACGVVSYLLSVFYPYQVNADTFKRSNLLPAWLHVHFDPLRCSLWDPLRSSPLMPGMSPSEALTWLNLVVRVGWIRILLHPLLPPRPATPHHAILPCTCRNLANEDHGRSSEG
jgi:hypothetical protein